MGLAGDLLAGRYRLDELIGGGGFSEVWRATDAVLERPVAVKLLHPGYARQPEALARFRAEARHAALLWHENVTHVYDYDEQADGLQPYLVMELVDGPCLAGVLAGGPLDAGRTMDIVAQTAAGLQAAHAAGLIHRDIKPGNLLLASDGTVKITDFGISHAIGSVPVTDTGIVMGTAGYLAPERIAGAQATSASDLYALGVVGYECLAGAPPFAGTPLEVACAHRDRPVPPLPESVPATVTALVMQLVAKDPAWRPVSAEVARQAGRLREDLRDGLSVGVGRTRDPLAAPAPATVPPPAPVIASAASAAEAWWPFPAAPWPGPPARTGARQRRRRPVPVLAPAMIAGLITMVLAVSVGAAVIWRSVGGLPAAQPGRPASGAAVAPPASQPSSASPGHKGRSRISPVDTGTLQMDASGTVTARQKGREKTQRHLQHKDASHGQGNGNSQENGSGQRNGSGQGNGSGQRNGNGSGQGQGNGSGHGQGNGKGNAPVRSVLSQLPAEVLTLRLKSVHPIQATT